MPSQEQLAFERELNEYITRRDAGGLPDNLALALNAVVTCGHALHSVRFGQAEATPDPGAAPTGRLDELINSLDGDIEELRAAVRRARIAFDRQQHLGTFDIRRLIPHRARRARITLDELRRLDRQYAALQAERQAAEDRRQAAEDRRQAAYDAARTLYIGLIGAAPPPGEGIFAALRVRSRHNDVSSHSNATTRYVYKFLRDPTLVDAVCRFQDECSANPDVSRFVAKDTSGIAERSEDEFANLVVADFAPRLRSILQSVVKLGRVEMRKLARNNGVDMEVLAYLPHGRDPFIALPIEVKRRLGDRSLAQPNLEWENLRENFNVLTEIDGNVFGGRNATNMNRALSQATTYVESLVYSQNRGVMLGKDSVVLLQRTNRNSVLVSDVIGYTSTRPHPVAAVAYWIREALFNPAQTIRLEGQGHAAEQGTGDDSEHAVSPGGRSGGELSSSAARTERGLGSPRRTSQAPGAGLNRSAPGGMMTRSRDLHHSSTTAVAVAALYADDEEPLDTIVDTSRAQLEFVKRSRCGKIYTGRWSDGQQVVVKATPVGNYELLDELRTEIRAYSRLHDLQGTTVPRLIAHGYANINGRPVGILVVEQIEGEKILSAYAMDTRSALKRLSYDEKFACLRALKMIHSCGVSPADIRGANILFRPRKAGERLRPVFIDFGFAIFETSEQFKVSKKDDYIRLLDAFNGISIYT